MRRTLCVAHHNLSKAEPQIDNQTAATPVRESYLFTWYPLSDNFQVSIKWQRTEKAQKMDVLLPQVKANKLAH